jgi:hypothetical protein
MPKFLRYIAGYHDPEIEQAIGGAGAIHVFPMYEYYATPLKSDGCAKLNVCFRRQAVDSTPSQVLGVATIERWFDLDVFSGAPPHAQRRRVLDELHSAVLSTGEHFGWTMERAHAAYDLIIRNNLRFQIVWAKPKASPDRTLRVRVDVDFADVVRLEVVFLDRKGQSVLKRPFSMVGPGLGVVEYVVGNVQWLDNTRVKITHKNGRDYWICGTDGTLEFYFPRAESGNPHGLFALGQMYCEGQYVLRDPIKGRQLVEAAARRGYLHATNYLQRMVEPGAAPNDGLATPLGNSEVSEGPPSVS